MSTTQSADVSRQPWLQPPHASEGIKINARTAADVVANPEPQPAILSYEDRAERFVNPLRYAQGGEIAVEGAMRAADAVQAQNGGSDAAPAEVQPSQDQSA